MKESTKIIIFIPILILMLIIGFFNLIGLIEGTELNCNHPKLYAQNYVTGLGFQLVCDRSNSTPEKIRIRLNERTEREKEIDRIATSACIEKGGIPEISNWDGDIKCNFKQND